MRLEKTGIFHNVIIHIKSVSNKDQSDYYYNVFLERFFINYLKIMMMNKFLYELLLSYDRIDVSEGRDVNKTSESKECDMSGILDKGYKFQSDV